MSGYASVVLQPGGVIRHAPWADNHEDVIRALGLEDGDVGGERLFLRAGAPDGDMARYYADEDDVDWLPDWYTEHEAEYREKLAELIARINALKARLVALDADRRSRIRELRADYLASSNALYAEYVSKYDALDDDYEAKGEALDAQYAPEYTIPNDKELAPEEIADALRAEYRAKRADLYANYETESEALDAWYEAQHAPLYDRYDAQESELRANYEAEREALEAEYMSLPGAVELMDWRDGL